jgi:hypothetical protein
MNTDEIIDILRQSDIVPGPNRGEIQKQLHTLMGDNMRLAEIKEHQDFMIFIRQIKVAWEAKRFNFFGTTLTGTAVGYLLHGGTTTNLDNSTSIWLRHGVDHKQFQTLGTVQFDGFEVYKIQLTAAATHLMLYLRTDPQHVQMREEALDWWGVVCGLEGNLSKRRMPE